MGYMCTTGYQGDLIFNLQVSCLLFYTRFVIFFRKPQKNWVGRADT